MAVTHPIHIESSSPFSIQNIPFGIFSTPENPEHRVATIIGEFVLDLSVLERHCLFQKVLCNDELDGPDCSGHMLFCQPTLNAFAAQPKQYRKSVRRAIQRLVLHSDSPIFADASINREAFSNVDAVILHLPFQIGGFTDFLTSEIHAKNCADLAGQRCHPSFYAFPTAYNGRASSVVVGGTPIQRPKGMVKKPHDEGFVFAPTSQLDFELELGVFISNPIPEGTMVTAEKALEHVFGLVLLNDWSARDIQFAEMIPLGPFNGKSTATSISPWVTVPEALEAAKTSTTVLKAKDQMQNLEHHLRQCPEGSTWDIDLEVFMHGSGPGFPAISLCRSNLKDCYWTFAQMIAHHSSSGCGLQTGDLIGSGTISAQGHTAESPRLGCLHELTKAGTVPIRLPNGRGLTWLEDGHEIIFSGWVRDGTSAGKVGFGGLRGRVAKGW